MVSVPGVAVQALGVRIPHRVLPPWCMEVSSALMVSLALMFWGWGRASVQYRGDCRGRMPDMPTSQFVHRGAWRFSVCSGAVSIHVPVARVTRIGPHPCSTGGSGLIHKSISGKTESIVPPWTPWFSVHRKLRCMNEDESDCIGCSDVGFRERVALLNEFDERDWRTYTYIYIYVYIYIYIYVCICLYEYIYIYNIRRRV